MNVLWNSTHEKAQTLRPVSQAFLMNNVNLKINENLNSVLLQT